MLRDTSEILSGQAHVSEQPAPPFEDERQMNAGR